MLAYELMGSARHVRAFLSVVIGRRGPGPDFPKNSEAEELLNLGWQRSMLAGTVCSRSCPALICIASVTGEDLRAIVHAYIRNHRDFSSSDSVASSTKASAGLHRAGQ